MTLLVRRRVTQDREENVRGRESRGSVLKGTAKTHFLKVSGIL